jgi:hypothetical protein
VNRVGGHTATEWSSLHSRMTEFAAGSPKPPSAVTPWGVVTPQASSAGAAGEGSDGDDSSDEDEEEAGEGGGPADIEMGDEEEGSGDEADGDFGEQRAKRARHEDAARCGRDLFFVK